MLPIPFTRILPPSKHCVRTFTRFYVIKNDNYKLTAVHVVKYVGSSLLKVRHNVVKVYTNYMPITNCMTTYTVYNVITDEAHSGRFYHLVGGGDLN